MRPVSYLFRLINGVKVKNKLWLLYIFCVLAPIVLIHTWFYDYLSDVIWEKQQNSLDIQMDRVRIQVSSRFQQCVSLSGIIDLDKKTNEALETYYTSPSDYINVYKSYLETELYKFMVAYDQIQKITIYTENPTIVPGGDFAVLNPGVKETDWYQKAAALKNNQAFVYCQPQGEGGKKTVSVVKMLNYYANSSAYRKIVKIDLYDNLLLMIGANEKIQGKLALFQEGRPVWEAGNDVENGTAIEIEKELGQKSYLKDWSLSGYFSDRLFAEALLEGRKRVIFLGSAVTMAASFLLFLISYSLDKRLMTVSEHLKNQTADDFSEIVMDTGKDEIGQLICELNRRQEKTAALIQEIVEGEKEKAKAELNALQSQINPHFLFNTINSIRLKSVLKGEMETAGVLKDMALLFRRALDWQDDFVGVEEELLFVQHFLQIQKYRYEDKLNYQILADDAAMSYKIPKMLIQPLVENASYHGIEMSERAGLICIAIQMEGETFCCSVSDNGAGISEEQLSAIRKALEEEDATGHIGIYNIYKRICYYFQGKAEFRIESKPGIGTEVSFRIPEALLPCQSLCR